MVHKLDLELRSLPQSMAASHERGTAYHFDATTQNRSRRFNFTGRPFVTENSTVDSRFSKQRFYLQRTIEKSATQSREECVIVALSANFQEDVPYSLPSFS